jgi:hypothetical protein
VTRLSVASRDRHRSAKAAFAILATAAFAVTCMASRRAALLIYWNDLSPRALLARTNYPPAVLPYLSEGFPPHFSSHVHEPSP